VTFGLGAFLGGRQTVDVGCTVDVEQTPESFHAYVELDGIEVGPGDEVIVHDAPAEPAWGDKFVVRRTATVIRASMLERLWVRLTGPFEFGEMYEVSFSDRRRL
jgi:hypothetical protein